MNVRVTDTWSATGTACLRHPLAVITLSLVSLSACSAQNACEADATASLSGFVGRAFPEVCGPGSFFPPSIATNGKTTVVGCVPAVGPGGGQVRPSLAFLDSEMRPIRVVPLRPTHGNPYPATGGLYFEGIDVKAVGTGFAAAYAYDCEPDGSLAIGLGGSCIDLRRFDETGVNIEQPIVFGEAPWSGHPNIATDGAGNLAVAFTSYVETNSSKRTTIHVHTEGAFGSRTTKVADAQTENLVNDAYRSPRAKIAWNGSSSTYGIFTAFASASAYYTEVSVDGLPTGHQRYVVEGGLAFSDEGAQIGVVSALGRFWLASHDWSIQPNDSWGKLVALVSHAPDGSSHDWRPLSTVTTRCAQPGREQVSVVTANGKLYISWLDPAVCTDLRVMLSIVDPTSGSVETHPWLPGTYAAFPALAVDESGTALRTVYIDRSGSVSAAIVPL